jgi:tetratricopeptide (TPR) repeat protein
MKHRGEFSKAKKTLNDLVLPHNTKSATVYMYSGIIYAALNEFKSAERFFDKAIALAPRDVDVTLLLMRAINANKFPEIALNYAKNQSSLFTNYGCIKLAGNLSDIFSSLGERQTSRAIEEFVIHNNNHQRSERNVCSFLKKEYL